MPKYILVRATGQEKLSENFGKPAIDKVKGFLHVGFSPDFSLLMCTGTLGPRCARGITGTCTLQ